MSRRMLLLASILLGLVICAGCSQEVNLFEGPWRPGYDATLVIEDKRPGKLCVIIDDKAVEWEMDGFYPVNVHFSPGPHRITWTLEEKCSEFGRWPALWTRDAVCTYSGEGLFNAQQGQFYTFQFAALFGDKHFIGSGETYLGWVSHYVVEVKQRATWIEEYAALFREPRVLVGEKPEWIKMHTCEICGKKNAAYPYQYGCPACRARKSSPSD
jgi:hypothetical protein